MNNQISKLPQKTQKPQYGGGLGDLNDLEGWLTKTIKELQTKYPSIISPSRTPTIANLIAAQKTVTQLNPREAITGYGYSDIYLSRNMISEVISVGTTPTLIVRSPQTWPYLIQNPARLQGITKIETGYSGTLTADANTQSTYIDVSAYDAAHLHLVISAISGEWDIYAQSYDSVSASWIDTQRIFSALTLTTDSQYAMIGPLGIAERLAFRFVEVSAGSITFKLGVTLKGGTGSGTVDFSNVIYLGGNSVTTVAGLALLPGAEKNFMIGANVELYGVATEATEVRVFSL
jgi:hypothetical protein